MANMTSGKEPRWTYASPTEKAQHGKPAALGESIAEYDLPEINVDVERRNFPGCETNQYFTLEDIQSGDDSGATDTDVATHKMSGKNTGGGYTTINQTSGSRGRPTKRS